MPRPSRPCASSSPRRPRSASASSTGRAARPSSRGCCSRRRRAASVSGSWCGPSATCPTRRRPRSATRSSRARRTSRAFAADFETGEASLRGRRLLIGSFGAAIVALGGALLFPIRSLGPRPGRGLKITPYAGRTKRVVRGDGTPIRPDDISTDGVLTAFPDGHTDAADAPTLLIRYRPDQDFQTQSGRRGLDGRSDRRLLQAVHARRLPGRALPGRARACCCARATSRRSTCSTAPGPSSDPPPARCPSCRSASTTTATSSPRVTSPARPGPASGTATDDRSRLAQRTRRRPAASGARAAVAPRRPAAQPAVRPLGRQAHRRRPARPHRAEQGVPGPLVVHDRRAGPLQLRHAGAHRHLPDLLLQPERERGRLQRLATGRCAAWR